MSDRAGELAELSQYPHALVAIDFTIANEYNPDDHTPVDHVDDAHGITSEIVSGTLDGWHTVMLDLDVPARLIPSSTPGNSHLYIDTPVSWPVLVKLLNVLAEAGIVETGYVAASEARGFTCLRLPWVKKPVIDVDDETAAF